MTSSLRRPLPISLAVFICAAWPTEVTAQRTQLSKVEIRLLDDQSLLKGRLYRVSSSKREYIANVDASGGISPSVDCEKSERFLAEPSSTLYSGDRTPKFCQASMRFEYRKAKTSSTAISAVTAASTGRWGEAQILFNNASAGSGAESPADARAYRDAAVASTAFALGDENLDLYVQRDPRQDFALVLSNKGVQKIKELQRSAGLVPSGVLDFKTQKAIEKHFANSPNKVTGDTSWISPDIAKDVEDYKDLKGRKIEPKTPDSRLMEVPAKPELHKPILRY